MQQLVSLQGAFLPLTKSEGAPEDRGGSPEPLPRSRRGRKPQLWGLRRGCCRASQQKTKSNKSEPTHNNSPSSFILNSKHSPAISTSGMGWCHSLPWVAQVSRSAGSIRKSRTTSSMLSDPTLIFLANHVMTPLRFLLSNAMFSPSHAQGTPPARITWKYKTQSLYTSNGQHYALRGMIKGDEVWQYIGHLRLVPHKNEV